MRRGRALAIVVTPGTDALLLVVHDALAAFDGPVVELHLSQPRGASMAPPVRS